MKWLAIREGVRLVVAVVASLLVTGRVCVELAGATAADAAAAAVGRHAPSAWSSRPQVGPSPAMPEWLPAVPWAWPHPRLDVPSSK